MFLSPSFSERTPCDRLGDLGPSVINLITSIYSTWFLWPGKRENTCTNLLCDAPREGKKRNSPHAKKSRPIKSACERPGFQSDARCLHLACGSNPPPHHRTASILPLLLCLVCNIKLGYAFSSPQSLRRPHSSSSPP